MRSHYCIRFLAIISCLTLIILTGCQSPTNLEPSFIKKVDTVSPQQAELKPQETYNSLNKLDIFLKNLSQTEQIPLAILKDAYFDVKPQLGARKLVSPPPYSAKKNWRAHRALFIDDVRLKAGERFWRENRTFLEKTEKETGVPIEVIVGILGIETMYGSNMGNFNVRDVLATLAFNYPESPNKASRELMFEQQLADLTIYCWKESVQNSRPNQFSNCLKQTSSFAGAIGMPQFMPTSIRKFAVDGDGDGTINLRSSKEDAIASVANFMVGHGWRKNEPIFLELSNHDKAIEAAKALADGEPEPKHTLASLKQKGILDVWQKPLTNDSLALIVDLPTNEKNGPSFVEYVVGLKNFEVITLYNRSFFYAKVVTDFGYEVGKRVRELSAVENKPMTKSSSTKHKKTKKKKRT